MPAQAFGNTNMSFNSKFLTNKVVVSSQFLYYFVNGLRLNDSSGLKMYCLKGQKKVFKKCTYAKQSVSIDPLKYSSQNCGDLGTWEHSWTP